MLVGLTIPQEPLPDLRDAFDTYCNAIGNGLYKQIRHKSKSKVFTSSDAVRDRLYDMYSKFHDIHGKVKANAFTSEIDFQAHLALVAFRLFHKVDPDFLEDGLGKCTIFGLLGLAGYLADRNQPLIQQASETTWAGKIFLKLCKKDSLFFDVAAEFFYYAGQDKLAESLAQKAKTTPTSLIVLGLCAMGKKENEKAYTCFKECIQSLIVDLKKTDHKNSRKEVEFMIYTARINLLLVCEKMGRIDEMKSLTQELQTHSIDRLIHKRCGMLLNGHPVAPIFARLVAHFLSDNMAKVEQLLDYILQQPEDYILLPENFLSFYVPLFQGHIFIHQKKLDKAKEQFQILMADNSYGNYGMSLCHHLEGDLDGAIHYLQQGAERGEVSCKVQLEELSYSYMQQLFDENVLTETMIQEVEPKTPEAKQEPDPKEDGPQLRLVPDDFKRVVNQAFIRKRFEHDGLLRQIMERCFRPQKQFTAIINKERSHFWEDRLAKPTVQRLLQCIKDHKPLDWRKDFGQALIMDGLEGYFCEKDNKLQFMLEKEGGQVVRRFLHNPDHTTGPHVLFSLAYHRFVVRMLEEAGVMRA